MKNICDVIETSYLGFKFLSFLYSYDVRAKKNLLILLGHLGIKVDLIFLNLGRMPKKQLFLLDRYLSRSLLKRYNPSPCHKETYELLAQNTKRLVSFIFAALLIFFINLPYKERGLPWFTHCDRLLIFSLSLNFCGLNINFVDCRFYEKFLLSFFFLSV